MTNVNNFEDKQKVASETTASINIEEKAAREAAEKKTVNKQAKGFINYLKSMNLTYSKKILIAMSIFFVITYLPLIFDWYIYASGIGWGLSNIMWIMFPIYFLMLGSMYFYEAKTFRNINIWQFFWYLIFALILGFMVYLLSMLSSQTFNDTVQGGESAYPMWALCLSQLILVSVVTCIFGYVVQLVLLNSLFMFPNSRARETCIRLFFKTWLKGWTTVPYTDHTLLVTRRGLYLLRLFYNEDNVERLTFEHTREVVTRVNSSEFAQSGITSQPSVSINDLVSTFGVEQNTPSTMNISTPNHSTPKANDSIVNFEKVDDDYDIKQAKTLAKEIERKIDIPVTPLFIFEGIKPTVIHKPEKFLFSDFKGFVEDVKNFEFDSNLKITKHDRILNEIKK